jgi:hypothetical protein
MRLLVLFAAAAIGVSFMSTRADDVFDRGTGSAKDSISNVNELLERAASGKPLDGRPVPDARWVRRMTAACVKRERQLASVPRDATPRGIAERGARILAVYRAYDARVASLKTPDAWRPEVQEIRGFNVEQRLIVRRVVAAARSGNLGSAMQQAVPLRELAGRANIVYLRIGLARCAFGASGMPL